MERRFNVLVEWEDSADKDYMDADEVQVWAEDAACAIRKARKVWRTTIGAQWPRCVVTAVRLTPRE
jgi:hypothetical protein